MLRIRLYGPLLLEVDARVTPAVAGLRPRSVLTRLLLHPGPHARARVAAQFCPGVLDTSARPAVQRVLGDPLGARRLKAPRGAGGCA